MGVEKETLINTGDDGLNEDEAARRLELFGPNQLKVKEDNIWLKLALEFVQPMPMMIWAAILHVSPWRRTSTSRWTVSSM